eukprot:6971157-Prymnesium_polylepis.1
MGDDESHAEITLTVLKEAHIYKLPPRPNAGGWRCQDWPKTNFIFQARVKIVARGAQCTVRLEDPKCAPCETPPYPKPRTSLARRRVL